MVQEVQLVNWPTPSMHNTSRSFDSIKFSQKSSPSLLGYVSVCRDICLLTLNFL